MINYLFECLVDVDDIEFFNYVKEVMDNGVFEVIILDSICKVGCDNVCILM